MDLQLTSHSLPLASVMITTICYATTAKEVGNNPFSYSSYQNVPSSSANYGTMNHKDIFSIPHCKTPNPCRDPNSLPRNVSRALLKKSRLFYATMGTCYGYTLAAEILLARKVRTYQELNQMCPTLFVNSPGDSYYSGYGKKYAQICSADAKNKLIRNCITLDNATDSDVEMTPMSLVQPTVIDTDETTYALFYRCVNRKYEDILLLTTQPYFSNKKVFNQVLGKILEFGFLESEILLWPCQQNCPKFIWEYSGIRT